MEKLVCINLLQSSDPAGACVVFGYHRGRGTGFCWRMRSVRLSPRTGNRVFPRPGPYFSVYGVILYKCCL